MDSDILKTVLKELLPEVSFGENKQYPEVIIPAEKIHDFFAAIRIADSLRFDYLISLTAVDWIDHFMIVYHLNSTHYRHTIVCKSRVDERINPEIESVSDIWRTAEFHEREVYDLFGIKFRHHPDLRRLFLEEGYGFPLRKDFSDESKMIVR